MIRMLIQHQMFLLTIVVLWMVAEPLHLEGHGNDHSQPCEICVQLSHQSVDIVNNKILIEPVAYKAELIQVPFQFHTFNFVAIFHERRGPPDSLS